MIQEGSATLQGNTAITASCVRCQESSLGFPFGNNYKYNRASFNYRQPKEASMHGGIAANVDYLTYGQNFSSFLTALYCVAEIRSAADAVLSATTDCSCSASRGQSAEIDLQSSTALTINNLRCKRSALGISIDANYRFNRKAFNYHEPKTAAILGRLQSEACYAANMAVSLDGLSNLEVAAIRVKLATAMLQATSTCSSLASRIRFIQIELGSTASLALDLRGIKEASASIGAAASLAVEAAGIFCGAAYSAALAASAASAIRVQHFTAAPSALTALSSAVLRLRLALSEQSLDGELLIQSRRARLGEAAVSTSTGTFMIPYRLRNTNIHLTAALHQAAVGTLTQFVAVTASAQTSISIDVLAVRHSNAHLSATTSCYATSLDPYRVAFNSDVRQMVPRVVVHFPGDAEPTTFEGQDITFMSLLEELQSESTVSLGAISSNELIFELDNVNGRFNPTNSSSTFYGKMQPNTLVEPFIGIYLSETYVEYVPLGKFWTVSWSPTTDIEVSVTCYDRLYFLSKVPLMETRVMENTTIRVLFESVFQQLEVASTDLSFKGTYDQAISIGWLPNDMAGKALQLLAEASHSSITTDRQGRIVIEQLNLTQSPVISISDDDQIVSGVAPLEFEDAYSQVQVSYHTPQLRSGIEVSKLSDIDLEIGETALAQTNFTELPVALLEDIAWSSDAEVVALTYSAWSYSLTFNSLEALTQDVQLTGTIVETLETPLLAEDEESLALIGKRCFSISNYLIQSQNVAQDYLDELFPIVTNPIGRVRLNVRGNPVIRVGNIIEVTDEAEHMGTLLILVTRNQMQYDSGLSSTIEGLKVEQEV